MANAITAGGPPTGSAGGDLGSTYPDPTVEGVNGVELSPTTAPTTSQVLVATSATTMKWADLPTGGLTPGTAGQVLYTNPSGAVAWGAAPVDWLNVVTQFGADPTGVADSSTAIQNAINAATADQVLYFPEGTYTIGTALAPIAGQQFTWIGASPAATVLSFNTSAAAIGFGTNAGAQRSIIRSMALIQAGAGDLMAIGSSSGNRLPQLSCYDVQFTLGSSNTGGSWINSQGPASSNSIAGCYFLRCIFSSNSSTRTVPGLNLTCQVPGGMSNCTWEKCDFNPSDNEQFCIYMSASSGASDNGYHASMAFRDCRFEAPTGGAIQSMSSRDLIIDNCYMWDLGIGGGRSLGNSLIYVGTNSSQMPSTGTRITGCGRYVGSAGTGPDGVNYWDIYVDANSGQTLIDSYATTTNFHTTQAPAYFNFNGCPSVTIINPSSTTVAGGVTDSIINPAVLQVQPALVPQVSQWMPADLGYVAWAFDPILQENTTTTRLITVGILNLIGVEVRGYATVGHVDTYVIGAGSGLVSSDCLIGLYNSAGTLLGFSADQSTAWASTGFKNSVALTAQSTGSLALTPGLYWVALLGNGTTMPSFSAAGGAQNISSVILNGHANVAHARYATYTAEATTVASGSNGGEISTIASWSAPSAGVLDVASTSGWPTSGSVYVAASGPTTALVTYTGTAAGQLTGCAYVSGSATGTVATGGAVTLAYTALPTSITPGSNAFQQLAAWWTGLF